MFEIKKRRFLKIFVFVLVMIFLFSIQFDETGAYCDVSQLSCPYPTPEPCKLNAFDLEFDCHSGSNTCWEGDVIKITADVEGDCSDANYLFTELYEQVGFNCGITNDNFPGAFSGYGDMVGVDGTIVQTELATYWTIPAVPGVGANVSGDCRDKTFADLRAVFGLYDSYYNSVVERYGDLPSNLVDVLTLSCYDGEEGQCDDGIDNDCDGTADCGDDECSSDPACDGGGGYDCSLNSISVTNSCSGGVCDVGDILTINAVASGVDCASVNTIQLDAKESSPPNHICTIGLYGSDDILGMFDTSPTWTPPNGVSGQISGTWTIPGSVPTDCVGVTLDAGTGRIYIDGDYEEGTLVSSKEGTGSFTFSGIPEPPECSDGVDNDGDGDIDYPNDGGCMSSDDSDETNCGDGVCEGIENGVICPTDCGCTLTGAYWADSNGVRYSNRYEVANNTPVKMFVTGTNCDSFNIITFKIYERDTILPDTLILTDYTSNYGTNPIWFAQYMDDGIDPYGILPEFEFEASIGSSGKTSQKIEVNETQIQDPISECEALDCQNNYGEDYVCCGNPGTQYCERDSLCNDPVIDDCTDVGGECCSADQVCLDWISSNECSGSCCASGCVTLTGPDTGRRISWSDCIDEDGDGIGEQNQTSWLIDLTTGQDIPGTTDTTGPYECAVIGTSVPFFTLSSLVAVLLLLIGYYVYSRKKKLF